MAAGQAMATATSSRGQRAARPQCLLAAPLDGARVPTWSGGTGSTCVAAGPWAVKTQVARWALVFSAGCPSSS